MVQDITFDSGVDQVTFSVAIISDEIAEGNETFEVFLKDNPNVVIGEPSVAVGTIIDDDEISKYLYFMMDFYLQSTHVMMYKYVFHVIRKMHTHFTSKLYFNIILLLLSLLLLL